ncbi:MULTISPECIES: CoA-binding protein [Bradyrhizobium]|uniref:CoA-binding protein n=1 Tax=Bradyrhizobium centrosematis TaxID=1300039 RepID=UPI002167E69B|nr:CoA-binding protein [Bradyrhizobium centrosematis]MCS3765649.1 acetyltransferase [Bradyrhizobium centrosematis]MCS3777875.1 acetyltransferase [Bradyrhizobium centrosematis]
MSMSSEKTRLQAVSSDARPSDHFDSGKSDITGNERSLRLLFEPKGIAVVGASPKPSLAKSILNNIVSFGYTGNIAAINPNYAVVDDVNCYSCISDVPFQIDLALLCIRAENILSVLEECEQRSVSVAQIISSGFAELGSEEGRARQRQIQRWAKESKTTTLVGPNSMGVINLHWPMIAAWANRVPEIVAGGVSGVFQSGQMVATMHPLIGRGIGISKIATTGNEAGTTTAEVINFFAVDPQTEIIICYSEGINDPERFAIACARAGEHGKPIVMLRVGAHPEVRHTIGRHTATQAAINYENDKRLLEELGVITVNSVEDLIETVVAFKACRNPRGNRVAFASFSGGMGNIMADLILSTPGLKLAPFSDQLRKRLADVLPNFANSSNPLDLSAQSAFDSDVLSGCMQVLGKSDELDILLWGNDLPIGIDDGSPIDLALKELVSEHPEIVVTSISQMSGVCWATGADARPPMFAGQPILQGTGVSVRAIGKVVEWHALRRRPSAQE